MTRTKRETVQEEWAPGRFVTKCAFCPVTYGNSSSGPVHRKGCKYYIDRSTKSKAKQTIQISL